MMKAAFSILLLLCATLASAEMAGQVSIERILPEQGTVGQKLWVLLSLENTGNTEKNVSITEMIGNAEFNRSEATPVVTLYDETYWFYEWEIAIPAHENASVGYWVIPTEPGSYVIPSAEVLINNISVYYLQEAEIQIRCNADSSCGLGETYLNCPEDCELSGGNTCDSAADGTCDPDCEPGFDTDCVQQNVSQQADAPASPDFLLPAIALVAIGAIALLILKTRPSKARKR